MDNFKLRFLWALLYVGRIKGLSSSGTVCRSSWLSDTEWRESSKAYMPQPTTRGRGLADPSTLCIAWSAGAGVDWLPW